MAVQALTTPTPKPQSARGWVEHHGAGRPLPNGTLIDVRHFNGEVTEGVAVGSMCFAPDGSPLPMICRRWSGWDRNDGGPMAPKFKAFRIRTAVDEEAFVGTEAYV